VANPALPSTGQLNVPGTLVHQSLELSYSGPLPPPAALKQYDEIVPGAAARIIAQAEKQTDHRIKLEHKVVFSGVSRSWWGLWVAAFLVLFAMASGSILVYLGHDASGAVIATTGLAGLATVFIVGTNLQKSERIEKAKIMAGTKPGKSK
jgi:uncharacterized membrane protein